MTISDNKKITTIQKEFNVKFPNLKLEFYKVAHKQGEGNPANDKIDPTKTIGEIRTVHTAGDLSINGHLKVITFENNFADNYGLNVHVFRKSGDIWLQTTSTDEWTLTEQNEHGKEQHTF